MHLSGGCGFYNGPCYLTFIEVIDIGLHFLHTFLHIVEWSETNITCNQVQKISMTSYFTNSIKILTHPLPQFVKFSRKNICVKFPYIKVNSSSIIYMFIFDKHFVCLIFVLFGEYEIFNSENFLHYRILISCTKRSAKHAKYM